MPNPKYEWAHEETIATFAFHKHLCARVDRERSGCIVSRDDER